MIKNGVDADQTNFNAAFVSRTADTSTTGKVSLNNAADTNSGGFITNAQRAINETFDAVGITGEGDASRKSYSSTNYVAAGDSHKVAIGKLDAQALTQTTAPVASTQLTGQVSIAQGGTGQSAKAPAFDALTPATTEGDIVLRGTSASVRFPVGTTAQVLTADTTVAGKVKWAAPAPANLTGATGTLPVANGGTGNTTASAAFDALAPVTTKADLIVRSATSATRLPVGTDAQVLTADSTQALGVKWATASSANPNVSNATGTLPIANGGTGQTTQQAAINSLTGTQTAGRYLRSDGTNASLASIQAADVPTLNQNTTGTASNVTGTVAIANGGTGQTAKTAAFDGLSPTTTLGDLIYNAGGTNSRLPVGSTGQVLSVGGSGGVQYALPNVSSVSGTLAIANGGTGSTTSTAAFNALAPSTTSGDLIAYNAGNVRLPVGSNGQVLAVNTSVSGNLAWTTINAAIASVFATYGMTTAKAVSANAVIVYDTKIQDTHNAFSNGTYTIPISGTYEITLVGQTTSGGGSPYVKLATTNMGFLATLSVNGVTGGTISFPATANQTITIQPDQNLTLAGKGNGNYTNQITIKRTGT